MYFDVVCLRLFFCVDGDECCNWIGCGDLMCGFDELYGRKFGVEFFGWDLFECSICQSGEFECCCQFVVEYVMVLCWLVCCLGRFFVWFLRCV